MVEIIHIMISLLASIIVGVLLLVRRMDPIFIALTLNYVMIVFYFIGLAVKSYLNKVVFKQDETLDNDTDLSA